MRTPVPSVPTQIYFMQRPVCRTYISKWEIRWILASTRFHCRQRDSENKHTRHRKFRQRPAVESKTCRNIGEKLISLHRRSRGRGTGGNSPKNPRLAEHQKSNRIGFVFNQICCRSSSHKTFIMNKTETTNFYLVFLWNTFLNCAKFLYFPLESRWGSL